MATIDITEADRKRARAVLPGNVCGHYYTDTCPHNSRCLCAQDEPPSPCRGGGAQQLGKVERAIEELRRRRMAAAAGAEPEGRPG